LAANLARRRDAPPELVAGQRPSDVLARSFLGAFDIGQPEPRAKLLEVGAGGRIGVAQRGVQVAQGGRLVGAGPGDDLRHLATTRMRPTRRNPGRRPCVRRHAGRPGS
jgi:hypothetical protein